MCPYRRCSKTFGRWRIAARRKPTARPSISAARQRRSLRPICLRVKRCHSPFHLGARRYSGPPISTWYLASPSHIPASASRSVIRAVRTRGPPDPEPPTGLAWPMSFPSGIGGSLALEHGLAFLEERPEPFLRIGHREEAVLQFPLEGKTLVHRHLESFRDGSLDEADCPGGMLRIREALRERHRLVPELRAGGYAVQEAPVERLFRRQHPTGRHQIDRAALADEAREALRAAGPGEDAQGDFRQPDSPRAVRRESEVRRHRDLKAAADTMAVDRGDEQLRRAFHFV